MLEFKIWLERHYPSQMFPANRAGIRDVRFGYSMNPSKNPPVVSRVGSDFVTGMGEIFQKNMGKAMPTFGSGYRNYFDELTSAIRDGKDLIVIKHAPYSKEEEDEDEETYKKPNLQKITLHCLGEIRDIPQIARDASHMGVDMTHNPVITYEPSEKEGYIKILFRFKFEEEKASDRLRLTKVVTPQTQPQNPNPLTT